MTDRPRAAALALLLLASPAAAQEVGIGLGRYFPQDDQTVYRVDLLLPRREVLDPALVAEYRVADQDGTARWYGLGADVSLFRGVGPGLYFVAGGVLGLGEREADSFWASWSAGVGHQVLATAGVSFSAEARWRGHTDRDMAGLEVLGRLGIRLGPIPQGPPSGALPPVRPSVDPGRLPPPDAPPPLRVDAPEVPVRGAEALPPAGTAVDLLLGRIIDTARGAMGSPYKWGGTGEGGFDCSGLIQYAYGEHGVALPRRSTDQAREGRAVPRDAGTLRPGDILTFAERGDRISHVGLYLGNGEFIHSASNGVQVSRLDPDDPYGRWWYQRWKGARRVVE